MNQLRLTLGLMGVPALFLPACSGGGSGSTSGGAGSAMEIEQVANGFGQILPHTVRKVDPVTGAPTQTVISIRKDADLINNVILGNDILPAPQWPTTATLPNGASGNHFLYAEFQQELDIDSVLSPLPSAQPNFGLTGTVTLVAQDPNTGITEPVPCRVFVNGQTYAGAPVGSPPLLPLQTWVELNNNGAPVAVDPQGAGFPGVASFFQGSAKLISPRTICFVADSDNDLSTVETFPVGRQIKLRMSTAVRAKNGNLLRRQGLACTTVGPDTLRPEVATTPPPINNPIITPGQGDTDVDPLTDVVVEFTEPIQPLTLGSLNNGAPPQSSSAIAIRFGPSAAVVNVPFTLLPVSVFDLTTFRLTPSFNFPGEGPSSSQCGVFNRVDVSINGGQFKDLAANTNVLGGTTFFVTGEGPGLANAPVAPDTIYIARSGAVPGASVVDLNGFGGSTGNPTFDASYQTFAEGNSNYANNPNVKTQGSTMRPQLTPGTCTFNGGSAGVFTLTLDSSLQDLLVRAPLITSAGDMMLGHALDSAFNNGPSPFGCQAAGGSLCSIDGKKVINPAVNGNTTQPALAGQVNGIIGTGAENLVSWAPHPNPPPLKFPPLCVSPYIAGQEPTSIDTTAANLLGPGNPFYQPDLNQPPRGLLTPEQNTFFQGPSEPGPTNPAACTPYMIRQQVGQYLYMIDRGRRELVVFNSNRMTVIDRLQMSDPTTLAMSPNLNLLAVVNQLGDTVTFVDIDPASATFHQIVQNTVVGSRPRGIAWDPENEDILVCNEQDGNVSIISAASLQVRKTISSQLSQPFDVAITPRQSNWGFQRNVYFAYILNRNGRLAIFESGPNSVNGWGYDDVIGIATATFRNPKAIQPDHVDLRSAVWIAHEGPLTIPGNVAGAFGTGAVSKLAIVSGISGVLPLNVQSLFIPQFRDLFLGVTVSTGAPNLSGVPVDLAFDDLRSLSALPNLTSFFSAGAPAPINGKDLVRVVPGPAWVNNNEPRYMFVAVPNPTAGSGVVDVLRIDQGTTRIDTNPFHDGAQSIQAPNVSVVMDYFRQ